jgi:Dolichyl-phosphate-mannose-protein mannosyltransferase
MGHFNITLISYLLWLVMILIALINSRQNNESKKFKQYEIIFMLFFLACLVLFRLPFIKSNIELNLDEGQMIAQAMKFWTDPIPWRSVDPTTSGPLNSYILMWPHIFNLPMNYSNARITGLVLIIISVLLLHKFVSHALDRRWSLIMLMPIITLQLFATEYAILSYSSELLSITFICGILYSGTILVIKNEIKYSFISGFLLGCIFMSKPQAFLIGLTLLFYFNSIYISQNNRMYCN